MTSTGSFKEFIFNNKGVKYTAYMTNRGHINDRMFINETDKYVVGHKISNRNNNSVRTNEFGIFVNNDDTGVDHIVCYVRDVWADNDRWCTTSVVFGGVTYEHGSNFTSALNTMFIASAGDKMPYVIYNYDKMIELLKKVSLVLDDAKDATDKCAAEALASLHI